MGIDKDLASVSGARYSSVCVSLSKGGVGRK